LSAAVREHYARVAEVDRLRMHVKDNILYYMQAIWSHEPPDQRYFRLYNIDVPIVQPKTSGVPVIIQSGVPNLVDIIQSKQTATASLPMPDVTVTTKKLVDVADLNTVLGYKGNYMIFA